MNTQQRTDWIGVARMLENGVIVMDLVATGPGGLIGDGRLTYAPTDPHYDEIRRHLGELRPGEEKLVPPF